MSKPENDDEAIASLVAPRFRRQPTPPPEQPISVAPEQAPTEEERTAVPSAGSVVLPIESLPEEPSPPPPVVAAPATIEAATAIVGDERFLPVSDPVLIRPVEPGPIRIFVPPGTPVHVIESGRVAEIDEHLAGEVTIRSDGDRFYHYRRLLPSSVRVNSGEIVAPGAVIGTVGEAIDNEHPCLVVGLRIGDGSWTDMHSELVGLSDPGELGLCVTNEAREWVDPLARDDLSQDDVEIR